MRPHSGSDIEQKETIISVVNLISSTQESGVQYNDEIRRDEPSLSGSTNNDEKKCDVNPLDFN